MAESSPLDLYVLLYGGTIAMILLASGVISFVMLYQRRIIKQDLAFKEAEAQHQQNLFHGTLEAIESERKRLARDLHDEVGASLSAMRLLVGQMQHQSSDLAYIDDISNKCKLLIDSTIDNVRRISNDLLPHGLEEFGLPYAIEDLCEKFVEISKIDVHLKIDQIDSNNSKINLIIYRLVQELLNNAIKHSEATVITLSLKNEQNELILNYSDDGIGFNFVDAYEKRSLGLKNIETRTKMINGTTKFKTKPNEGLKLEVRIPLI